MVKYFLTFNRNPLFVCITSTSWASSLHIVLEAALRSNQGLAGSKAKWFEKSHKYLPYIRFLNQLFQSARKLKYLQDIRAIGPFPPTSLNWRPKCPTSCPPKLWPMAWIWFGCWPRPFNKISTPITSPQYAPTLTAFCAARK